MRGVTETASTATAATRPNDNARLTMCLAPAVCGHLRTIMRSYRAYRDAARSVVLLTVGSNHGRVVTARTAVAHRVKQDGNGVTRLERRQIDAAALHVGDIRHLHCPVLDLAVGALHIDIQKDVRGP